MGSHHRREGVVAVQKRRDRRTNRLITLYAPAECVVDQVGAGVPALARKRREF